MFLKHNPPNTRVIFLIVFLFSVCINAVYASPLKTPRAYYVNNKGNDKNSGDKNHPFKTIARSNRIKLHAGDSIRFASGQVFRGTLQINKYAFALEKPILIFSGGERKAIIDGGNKAGVEISETKFVQIRNLQLKGSGRKEGNTGNGVLINNCTNISIDNLNITGFQKAGLLVYSSSDISITRVHAYENGFAGISIDGEYGTKNSKQILISDCLAENNPGDPSNFKNHSGNGIIAGNCKNVTIEYCIATNNGWDMPRIGNGPVGIWCYEADSIKIQYCISYKNKTAKWADDGGGFDLDGGVTNSVIQYCLSYENHGSAFGIFQYEGASPWHDNIIRNNISEDDGSVSAAHASAYIWNSSGDDNQFSNLAFHNNILSNIKGAAIHYADKQSKRKSFIFYKNIFVAKNEIIKGKTANDDFSGNIWWSVNDGFNVDSIRDFKTWALKTGKELSDGKIIGINKNPDFKDASFKKLTDPHKLKSFIDYQLSKCEEMKMKEN
ncbi:MAG TPA: right-handed parallel beta-helix repeat-containing protein [Chitinophagaceae bacterium]|nr:right-handed parallel beta-helix repeat-containing protein [Chitinophagaceae bacterium]